MSVSCPVGFQAYDLARSASEISSYFRLPNNGVLKMDRSKLRFKKSLAFVAGMACGGFVVALPVLAVKASSLDPSLHASVATVASGVMMVGLYLLKRKAQSRVLCSCSRTAG